MKRVDVSGFHEMPRLSNRAQTEPKVITEGQESLWKRKQPTWKLFRTKIRDVSISKTRNSEFQLLVQKLERRPVLFSPLLPLTGRTKTGRKTTFRAHLGYICVKLQICVVQKQSFMKRPNMAKQSILPP